MNGLTVGVVGCGLIGRKRVEALREHDEFVGCTDIDPAAAASLAADHGGRICADFDELLALSPQVVIVATSHDQLAPLGVRALSAGAHVLVEKPAGLGTAEVRALIAAAELAERRVKVGFNHRFHPGLARAAAEVQSGAYGELLHIRGRYGHGGRPGYNLEWRALPARSGGGELIDQGMHLLDLTHWIAGPLPLHCALLKSQFWEAEVEDNAVLVLGAGDDRKGPWALLHVSWTEWKNMFSLEIYCRTAKIVVDGLVRSYGPQTLRIYKMRPELGPPDREEVSFSDEDHSWRTEWRHFAAAIEERTEVLGGLADALYAWELVEEAYASSPFATMRERLN